MKPNKPNAQEKRSTLETLHTLWVPMAVGAVLLGKLKVEGNIDKALKLKELLPSK